MGGTLEFGRIVARLPEDCRADPELLLVHVRTARSVTKLEVAHFPMLSRPELVAAAIEEAFGILRTKTRNLPSARMNRDGRVVGASP